MVWSNDAPYRDRVHAGQQLAASLAAHAGADTLVLGIPRGGVEVGLAVAAALGASFDVLPARKLGAPMQPELAIGAVTAEGGISLDDALIGLLGVTDDYLAATIERESREARRRLEVYRGEHPAEPLAGRVVTVVDDGLATGATARAALRAARQQGPARLILAAPVGSPEAVRELRREVDEVVCPLTPADFWAVGSWYHDFRQLSDQDVVAMIEQWRQRSLPA